MDSKNMVYEVDGTYVILWMINLISHEWEMVKDVVFGAELAERTRDVQILNW
jgi:hypothetical protein